MKTGWDGKGRVAILGLGLMGGSLGLALKRGVPGVVVAGYARRGETRKLALKRGVVDEVYDDPCKAVTAARIAVFCTPVLSIPELAASCADRMPADCAVTDVGSTKLELTSKMSMFGPRFIGSHPMAGSEMAGLDSARATLYDGCAVVMTYDGDKKPNHYDLVSGMWKAAGAASVISMTPRRHDEVISRTSHLPHLAAAAIVACVNAHGSVEGVPQMCGPGFRDTTRVAGGSPDVWHDITASNAHEIELALKEYSEVLGKLRTMIHDRDFDGVRRFLSQARDSRNSLLKKAAVND